MKAGAVAVPVNLRLTRAEVNRVLEDAKVAMLATDSEQPDRSDWTGPVLGFGDAYEAAIAAESGETLENGPAPNDLAVIAYTSGTTGIPKGAVWSHQALIASARNNPFPPALASGRRVLLCAPLFAAGAVVMACNALAVGGTLVVTQFNSEYVLQNLADEAIEVTGLLPTMMSLLLEAAPRGWRAPRLRRIYYGAGAMSPGLFLKARALFDCEFEQGYGMTETCILGTRLGPADHDPSRLERLSSAGKAMPGVEIKVVGEDGGKVGPGVEGEICIRSPGNMAGYWNRPEESAVALRDGWYHTRDMGRVDAEGYLYVVDRKDDMVKSGGLNVFPGEVEAVLLQHPGVEEAAVIGRPDERWGQRVMSVVRRRAGADVTEEDLVEFCRGRLAGYKLPRKVVFTASPLPRNALGKILRRAIRAAFGE